MLTHNSTVSKNEPSWNNVDKLKLSRNSHADMGKVEDSTTWRFAHHWTENGRTGEAGIYIDGTMYLHAGGLEIALAETKHMDDENPVRKHLLRHAFATGTRKERKKTTKASIQQIQDRIQKAELKTEALNDYSLKAICEAITACQSIESLKAIEDTCLLHFSQAEKSGRNWIEKDRAKNESRQVTELVSYRRRAILSKPALEKARQDYQLGQKIGLAK